MKVEKRSGYILVVAPGFVRWWGTISTGRDDIGALAFFPFIIFHSESGANPWAVNHELIHFRQAIETLFVGLLLIGLIEHLYARLILRKSKQEAYLYMAAEQEAYRNQQDLNYLKRRKFGTYFHYLRHKREFILGEPGEIRYAKELDK